MDNVDAEAVASCPLCGAGAFRRLSVPRRWTGGDFFEPLKGRLALVECRACRLVYTNPRPSSSTLAAFYNRDDYEFHDSAGTAATGSRADFFLERVLRHLPSHAPRTLLDFGAGGGGFLHHAKRRGFAVTAYEPSPRGLASCLAGGLDATDRLDDLPSSAFGVVTLHHVVEHLRNPTDTLRTVRRFLAPGGRLYVEVPNAHSLRARLALPFLSRHFAIDERHRAYPIHLFYYSPQTLRQQLIRSGWSVAAMFTVGLGIDELILRNQPEPQFGGRASHVAAVPHGARSRTRWRRALRDGFLDACLGENLGAIARVNDDERVN
jgi:SAM-dependent methyltransferase